MVKHIFHIKGLQQVLKSLIIRKNTILITYINYILDGIHQVMPALLRNARERVLPKHTQLHQV